MIDKRPQKERIIEKLRVDGEVDNVWAFNHYILRLGAIIHKLRSEGWEIEGKFFEGTKNWNYTLKAEPKGTLIGFERDEQGIKRPVYAKP